MKKNGFTLTELLAVIVLLGILITFAVPNVIKLFGENKSALSTIQKRQVESAVNMYITDYCVEPINSEYVCPANLTTALNSDGQIYVVSGTVSIEDLANSGYMEEGEITHNCAGYVNIDGGKINLDNLECNFNGNGS